MAEKPAFRADELMPRVALGVAAHPDDLDFGMAGTMAKWAAGGTDVYYLILTNGNKGSADPAADPRKLTETRRSEQRAAAAVIGVKDVFFCDYEDGMLEVCPEVKCDIARYIRKTKPDVVLTFDPAMLYSAERGFINHPDHRAAGQAALDAVYPLARDHMSFPNLATGEHLPPHKTPTVLLINFDRHNYYVDISDFINLKMAAVAAHASQLADPAAMQKRLREHAGVAGKAAGVRYAEPFLRIDIAV